MTRVDAIPRRASMLTRTSERTRHRESNGTTDNVRSTACPSRAPIASAAKVGRERATPAEGRNHARQVTTPDEPANADVRGHDLDDEQRLCCPREGLISS